MDNEINNYPPQNNNEDIAENDSDSDTSDDDDDDDEEHERLFEDYCNEASQSNHNVSHYDVQLPTHHTYLGKLNNC